MVLRLTTAHESHAGATILYEGQAYTVRSNDISKTGKHGASKCRLEAISILTGNKKIIAVPGDTKFDVPNIDKRRAQVLTASEDSASIMDLESFETIDVPIISELKGKLVAEQQVEYWDIEGTKCIMRASS
jgi:translation initiation factor 5A